MYFENSDAIFYFCILKHSGLGPEERSSAFLADPGPAL